MRYLILTVIFAVCSMCVSAQLAPGGSQFDAAVEAFESGEYEQTIALLAAYEKSRGTSPRLESLRALAFRDLEKPKEAHQAILVYLRLTANRDMSGSEAHQDMLKLRDEMLEAIEKKYKEDKENLDEERDEAADAIVAELESVYSSPEIKRSYSSALPASLKSEADNPPGEYIGPPPSASKAAAPGMDALAELEMWRKISGSTVAMDYFLFIETFPNGQFTEIARKKMHEIGDPAWNAVRESHDPFKFREFIKANPDSPFLDVAQFRMESHAKTALEWEQVRDSRDPSTLRAFEARHPGHTLAAESKKLRAEIAWRGIENVTSPTLLRQFLAEFPESPHAAAARRSLGVNGAASTPDAGTAIASAPARPVTAFTPSGDPAGDLNRMADAMLVLPSFRTKTVIVSEQSSVTVEVEFVAPDRIRVINTVGPNSVVIGKDVYTESNGRLQKTGTNPQANPDMRAEWDKKSRELLSDVKFIGEDTVNGRPAYLYTALNKGVDGSGANDAKFWIAKFSGLPIRQEAKYKTGPIKSMTIDYDFDSNILIEPPAGQGLSSSSAGPQNAISLLHIHPGTFSNKLVRSKLEFDGTKLSVTESADSPDAGSGPKHNFTVSCSELKISTKWLKSGYLIIGPKRSAQNYAASGEEGKAEVQAFADKLRSACNLTSD